MTISNSAQEKISDLFYGIPSEGVIKRYIEEGFSMEFIANQLNGTYCKANFGSCSSVWEYEENGVKKKGLVCHAYSGGIAGTSHVRSAYFDEKGNRVKKEDAKAETKSTIGGSEFFSKYWLVIAAGVILVAGIIIFVVHKRKK